MAKEDEDDLLPDKDAAKGFYAKYEPKEILGRGISSTVRRCIEKETGKEFAAKIIDLGSTTENGDTNPYHMLEATRQEISILRQVMGHPYIIDLQDVFESDAFVFLVFELCPKGELFDYLTSVVTLSEKKTRTIMRQIFEGVEYIHSKNIVHRDLKPENILLDENHNVKITDFGFARQLVNGEKLTDLCGTPGYLAPETLKCNMFEGAPGYSQEVDIWACGVIMFTLLVGCPPFWHRKQMVMLRNIMEGKYNFTSPEWADISEDPKDLIRKCLVVDPSQRINVTEILRHPFFNQMVLVPELVLGGSNHNTYILKSSNATHESHQATSSSQNALQRVQAKKAVHYAMPEKAKRSRNFYGYAPCSSYSSMRTTEGEDTASGSERQRTKPESVAGSDATTSSPATTTTTATVYYCRKQLQQNLSNGNEAATNPEPYDRAAVKDQYYNQHQAESQVRGDDQSTPELRRQSRFNPRKKFQFAILVVRAIIRIRRLRYTAEPLRVEEAIKCPYNVKVLRKIIDGCAFRVYGHWVKKGEGQNRAALFENMPRTELHALYINNLSR